MKIILDAMGGDNAPSAVISGAVTALKENKELHLLLIGREDVINNELRQYDYDVNRISVVNATEEIEMNDIPTKAIRSKKDSSIVKGLQMLSDNKADIMISAGNTGALMAGATLIVKRLPGVKRPPIITQLPSKKGSVLLLDCGANADCKSEYLLQFAKMGCVYMSKFVGINNPRIGLVNNGTEPHKGNTLTKEAYQVLDNSGLNFAGNVEANDILSGNFDVVVTDGFTGNVILKNIEGMASLIMGELKDSIMSSPKSKFGAVFMKDAFRDMKKKFDYSEYGGSLLLGLNKGVVKAHGKSDAKAFASAIRMARKFVSENVIEEIKTEIGAENEL